MGRNTTRLVLASGITICWLSVQPLIDRTVYYVPQLFYRVHAASIKAECAQIKRGMDLRSAREILTRGITPTEQSFTGNRAIFGTTSAACYVEFDSNGLVSRASLERPVWEY